jgi:hypothetical protein
MQPQFVRLTAEIALLTAAEVRWPDVAAYRAALDALAVSHGAYVINGPIESVSDCFASIDDENGTKRTAQRLMC